MHIVCHIRQSYRSDFCYSVKQADYLVSFRDARRLGYGKLADYDFAFIKSLALPVGISLGGGLSAMVFLAKHLGHIPPYSLMAYGMNSSAPQELIKSGYVSFVVICIVYR